MVLERDLQKRCVKYAKKHGFWCSKFVAQGRRSVPDYIFAHKNEFEYANIFFVEFKRAGEKPTEQQKAKHEEMRAFGIRVYVIDNYENFVTLIHDIKEHG